MNNIIVLVAMLALFSQPVFFSLLGALGLQYEGLEASPVYVIYIVSLFLLNFGIYIYFILTRGFLSQEIIILSVFLIMFLLHLLWALFDSINTEILPKSLIFFILFGLPGFFTAVIIIKAKSIRKFIRFTEVLLLLVGATIIKATLMPTLLGTKTTALGGASYQSLSYYSAFISGMLLFYIIKVNENDRVRCSARLWYKFILYSIVVGCMFTTLLGGGRGAFLLLILYLLIAIYYKISLSCKELKYVSIIKNYVFMVLILCASLLLINLSLEIEFIQSGFKRATQYFTSEGIDIKKGSSGRDVVYQEALRYIDQSPIIGYGPFSYLEKTIQGHNIILDILLQYGFVGIVFILAMIFCLFIRIFKNWSSTNHWVLVSFLYPMLMLIFSGVYLHTTLFVFGLSYFTLYKKIILSPN